MTKTLLYGAIAFVLIIVYMRSQRDVVIDSTPVEKDGSTPPNNQDKVLQLVKDNADTVIDFVKNFFADDAADDANRSRQHG